MFGWFRKKSKSVITRDEGDAKIEDVLVDFPGFWQAYSKLKEEIRERYNWACDSLCYLPDGVKLYDENQEQIAVALNENFAMVATGEESTLGYTFVWRNALEE